MKLYLDCIPCFQRQALFATRDLEEKTRAEILRKVMNLLYNRKWNISPDELSQDIYELIRHETGIEDLYHEIKKASNQEALEFYPHLKERLEIIRQGEDRLFAAVKIAIAGNIIDFGPQIEIDLDKTISEVLGKEPGINHFARFYEMAFKADDLLYFADNAGEVVFDKILIEELIALRKQPFRKISFVVKGVPVINDAMLQDAQEVGIDRLPNLVFLKLGDGDKETGPRRRDDRVRQWIKDHDMIISKGQGNFEGLSDNRGVCFLLIAKCPIIAEELGVKKLDTIIKYDKR
jgi:uncharacterized protein with ATP-grasp and redox domains